MSSSTNKFKESSNHEELPKNMFVYCIFFLELPVSSFYFTSHPPLTFDLLLLCLMNISYTYTDPLHPYVVQIPRRSRPEALGSMNPISQHSDVSLQVQRSQPHDQIELLFQ
uniref:Uncharacterized protein n=1 Tax=Noccaea caerulescens TaxID=107243 RepID=A0A1J3I0S1_NOCCA